MSLRAAVRASHPLAPLPKRRLIVASVAVGWALLTLGHVFQATSGNSAATDFLTGFGLGLTLVVYLLLMMPWKLGLPSLNDYRADERQRQRLLEVYALAYRVIGVLGLLGVMYLLTASSGELPLPGSRVQWYPVLWAALILIGALPTAILAWTERDLDDSLAGGRA